MQVVIQKIPENLQEFETLAAKGRQPEHICALFLCALALFDRDKDAGTAAMNPLRGPKPMTPYDGQFLRDRLRGKAYLPLAYFEGATPENGYQPQAPYTLNVPAAARVVAAAPGNAVQTLDRHHVLRNGFTVKIFLPLVGQHTAARACCCFDKSHLTFSF